MDGYDIFKGVASTLFSGGLVGGAQSFFGDSSSDFEKTSAYNSAEAEKQRAFNATEAQKYRDWYENMSNSAYQRAAADMRSAGLNPYLVYGGASAASASPGGGQASGNSAYSAMTSTDSSKMSAIASLATSAAMLMRFMA